MTEVAFLGLGVMGDGMARRLIDSNFKLRVFDVAESSLAPFRQLDCRVAGSAREAAAGAQAVICMLPDVAHVETALFGPEGACVELAAAGLVIDMSTISASGSDRICAEVRKRARTQ
jgi:3-hydroxyisobutyrate dehydrogenase-like beta-hydroxyacid dehydrogenase